MEPTIKHLTEKKLVGNRLDMSLAENKTGELWQSFMQRRKAIGNSVGSDLYSMQIYEPSYFSNFNPTRVFEKWATIEVKDFEHVPEDMEVFVLPEGLYAVFLHKGGAATAAQTFQHIFSSWLPGSGYILDNRPHFELLGEKYKNGDPNSEEEIWIPIKPKL